MKTFTFTHWEYCTIFGLVRTALEEREKELQEDDIPEGEMATVCDAIDTLGGLMDKFGAVWFKFDGDDDEEEDDE